MKQAKMDTSNEVRGTELMQILGYSDFETTQIYTRGFGKNFFKTRKSNRAKDWDDL